MSATTNSERITAMLKTIDSDAVSSKTAKVAAGAAVLQAEAWLRLADVAERLLALAERAEKLGTLP